MVVACSRTSGSGLAASGYQEQRLGEEVSDQQEYVYNILKLGSLG
jgi:hypothetical protein